MFQYCLGPGMPAPVEVIAHCGDQIPCLLPQGTEANVNITFNIRKFLYLVLIFNLYRRFFFEYMLYLLEEKNCS